LRGPEKSSKFVLAFLDALVGAGRDVVQIAVAAKDWLWNMAELKLCNAFFNGLRGSSNFNFVFNVYVHDDCHAVGQVSTKGFVGQKRLAVIC
jgi:hypothetical protein